MKRGSVTRLQHHHPFHRGEYGSMEYVINKNEKYVKRIKIIIASNLQWSLSFLLPHTFLIFIFLWKVPSSSGLPSDAVAQTCPVSILLLVFRIVGRPKGMELPIQQVALLPSHNMGVWSRIG